MKNLKFLLIHTRSEEKGGAETNFLAEIELLRRNGVKVFTFSFSLNGKQERYDYVYQESRHRLLRKIFKYSFNPLLYYRLRRYLRRISPDIVHLHMNEKYPLTILAALRGYRVIKSVHTPYLICRTSWSIYRDTLEICPGGIGLQCVRHKCINPLFLPFAWIFWRVWKNFSQRRIQFYLPPSHHLAEQLKAHGFNMVRVLPYFAANIDIRYQTYPENSHTVLFVGVLSKQKGVNFLLKAFKHVVARLPQAKLEIVGDGPEKPYLESLAEELNISHCVNFLGRISHAEVKHHYATANVCVVPSIWKENSPLVIYEALASGRPVVGSQRGGIPELIENSVRGFIVNVKDSYLFAEKIIKLLSNPSLAEQMGRKGHLYFEQHLTEKTFGLNLQQVISDAFPELSDRIFE
jgi:glycosyltransferase involved in cell wall biosynthesis